MLGGPAGPTGPLVTSAPKACTLTVCTQVPSQSHHRPPGWRREGRTSTVVRGCGQEEHKLRGRNSELNRGGRHVSLYAIGSRRFLTGSNKTLRVSESHTVTLLFIAKSSTVLFKNWKPSVSVKENPIFK